MHITRRNPVWPGSPRRTGPDFAVDEHGFPITTNTRPADLDGAMPEPAHAASEHTEADDFLTVNQLKTRARARLLAALTAVGAVLLVAVLASAGRS